MSYKRLSSGRFRYWPRSGDAEVRPLEAYELQLLISGADFEAVQAASPWRSVKTPA